MVCVIDKFMTDLSSAFPIPCFANSTFHFKTITSSTQRKLQIGYAIQSKTPPSPPFPLLFVLFQNPISLIPPFRPVVDGHFMPEPPEVLAARGEVTGRHFLTGATLDEGLIAGRLFLPVTICDPMKLYRLYDLLYCVR